MIVISSSTSAMILTCFITQLLLINFCEKSNAISVGHQHFSKHQSISQKNSNQNECNVLQASPFFREAPKAHKDLKHQLIFLTEFARFLNVRVPALLQEFAESKKIFSTKSKLRQILDVPSGIDIDSFRRHKRSTPASSRRKVNSKRYRSNRQDDSDDETSGGDSESGETEDESDDDDNTENGADSTSDDDDETNNENEGDDNSSSNDEGEGESDDDDNTDNEDDSDDDAANEDDVNDEEEGESSISDDATEIIEDAIDVVADNSQEVVQLFQDIIASVGTVLQESVPPTVWNYICVATWFPLEESQCTSIRCTACAPAIMSSSIVCRQTAYGELNHRCIQDVMGEGFCNFCITDYIHKQSSVADGMGMQSHSYLRSMMLGLSH